MNRHFIFGVMASIMTLLPAGCSNDEPADGGRNPFTPVNLPENSRRSVTAEQEFSADLFRFVAGAKGRSENQSNFCLSPFSAYASLTMLVDGASTPTKEVLRSILAGNDASLTAENIKDYISTMSGVLPRLDKRSKCSVDYALWYDPGMTLTPGFEQSLKLTSSRNFKIFSQSPAGEEGMRRINNWVKVATNGEIPEFLENPLGNEMRWVLLNACYFKGEWKEVFNSANTAEGSFDCIDGTRSTKAFMRQKKSHSYTSLDGVNYLRLPFGNGNFVMNLMLPEAPDGYAEMLRNLSARTLSEAAEKAAIRTVEFSMPKFTDETDLNLTPYLAHKAGDVSDLILDNLFVDTPAQISFIMQKSRIVVDEKGAVAASATGTIVCTSPGPTELVKLDFNRPFIYTIEETSTGTILYIGSIVR